ECVLNRYADTKSPRGSDPERVCRIRPYIRSKLKLRQGAIPESARIFEVGKKLQVLVVNFAVERAIEIFAVDRGECRGSAGEVKALLFPRKLKKVQILRIVCYIWECVRRGC